MFLQDLEDPLLTFDLYQSFIDAVGICRLYSMCTSFRPLISLMIVCSYGRLSATILSSLATCTRRYTRQREAVATGMYAEGLQYRYFLLSFFVFARYIVRIEFVRWMRV
jgi:hypothetical protein